MALSSFLKNKRLVRSSCNLLLIVAPWSAFYERQIAHLMEGLWGEDPATATGDYSVGPGIANLFILFQHEVSLFSMHTIPYQMEKKKKSPAKKSENIFCVVSLEQVLSLAIWYDFVPFHVGDELGAYGIMPSCIRSSSGKTAASDVLLSWSSCQ